MIMAEHFWRSHSETVKNKDKLAVPKPTERLVLSLDEIEFKLLIQNIDWISMAKRLLLYSAMRISRMTWRGIYNGPPPGGYTAADFAQEAIKKFLAGQRKVCKGATEKDVYKLLIGTISSDVNHLAVSIENSIGRYPTVEESSKRGNINNPIRQKGG